MEQDPPQPTKEEMQKAGCLYIMSTIDVYSEAHAEHMRINGDCPWCGAYDKSKWLKS
jgi:hypothetical protein